MIQIEDLKQFIKDDDINWVNAHISSLEEKKEYFKRYGAMPQDIALIGLLLFLDSKEDAIKWSKNLEDLRKTRIEVEEFLKSITKKK